MYTHISYVILVREEEIFYPTNLFDGLFKPVFVSQLSKSVSDHTETLVFP